MTPAAALAESLRRGIVLDARGGRLTYDAPAGALTPALRSLLAEHKAGLLDLLADAEPYPPGLDVHPPSWRAELACWPHDWWSRWRRRSTEIQAGLGVERPDVAQIEAADRRAYDELSAEMEAADDEAWQRRLDADPDLARYYAGRVAELEARQPKARLPEPVPTPKPWRDVAAAWPMDRREAWARRAEALQVEGLGWREAEERAYSEMTEASPCT